jgi:hypothetical protein
MGHGSQGDFTVSDHPTTFAGENPDDHGIEWEDWVTLHRREDGGLLHSFKAIRKGTLAQMVRSFAALPSEERSHYIIEKAGDRQYHRHEIMALVKRLDFPLANGA